MGKIRLFVLTGYLLLNNHKFKMKNVRILILKMGKLLAKGVSEIYDNIFVILLLISMCLNYYFAVQDIRNQVAKEKIKEYQQIIIKTNSMAVESAYADSIAGVIHWWLN